MRHFSLAVGALLAGLAFAGPARAALLQFESPLGPEAIGATGTGFVTVVFDTITHVISIGGSFIGLSGNTTAAHIHCCTAAPNTGFVGVAVDSPTLPIPIGVQSGAFSIDLDLDLASNFSGACRIAPANAAQTCCLSRNSFQVIGRERAFQAG